MTGAQSPAPSASARWKKLRPRSVLVAIVAVAAMCDWVRPPGQQWSVRAYDFAVIGFYRAAVRPITKHLVRCRFRPTCSEYSEQAMALHGFPRGVVLTTVRLVRCGPWVRAGTRDPVPP